jgi:TRAP-type C4-dicarboxylate transport system substrate-binding protein
MLLNHPNTIEKRRNRYYCKVALIMTYGGEIIMKKTSIFVSVLVITLILASMVISCKSATEPTQPTESAKPKESKLLRLAVPYPAGDEMCNHFDQFIAQFNEAAAGEYEMKLYPAETLIKVPESIDAVRTGAVEMTSVACNIFGGLDPRFAAAGLPLTINNVKANAYLCETITPVLSELYAEFNHKLINTYQTDGLELHSNKPIKTMDDWSGMIIAAIDPECAKLSEILGASSVVVPWTEVYSALEKGVVDATYHSTEFALIGKLYDVTSFTLMWFAMPTMLVTSINMDVWNKMPENLQNKLLELGQWSMQNRNEYFIAAHDEKIKTLRDLGQEVYILPKEERDKWVDLAKPYTDERLAGMGEFGEQVRIYIDQANKRFP